VLLQPGSSEAQINLAQTLMRQKKFVEAAELLEAVAEPSSRNPEIFELLAQAYSSLGRRQDAQARSIAGQGIAKFETAAVNWVLMRSKQVPRVKLQNGPGPSVELQGKASTALQKLRSTG